MGLVYYHRPFEEYRDTYTHPFQNKKPSSRGQADCLEQPNRHCQTLRSILEVESVISLFVFEDDLLDT